MQYDPKPAPIQPEVQPLEETQPSEELRELQRKRSQVLSRKAVERTLILEKSSRYMIEASKAMVSKSKQQNAKAHRTLARRPLAA